MWQSWKVTVPNRVLHEELSRSRLQKMELGRRGLCLSPGSATHNLGDPDPVTSPVQAPAPPCCSERKELGNLKGPSLPQIYEKYIFFKGSNKKTSMSLGCVYHYYHLSVLLDKICQHGGKVHQGLLENPIISHGRERERTG